MADFDVILENSPVEMEVLVDINPVQFDVTVELGFIGPQGIPGETVLQYVAGQPLSSHFAVKLNEDAKAVYASCSDDGSFFRVIGITQNSSLTDGVVLVRKYGVITEPSWNWDMGKLIYLGEDGRIVQDLVMAGKFVQLLGYPVSPTSLFVNINTPIITV